MSNVTYSREVLADLADRASTPDEVLLLLGLEPTHQRRSYLRRKLTEYGIVAPHLANTRIVYSRELLEEAVSSSESYAGVLRHLNLRQAGGTQAHIARRIRQFGIDTDHFTGEAHCRGKRASNRKGPDELLTQRPYGATRVAGWRLRRALLESGLPDTCAECGQGPVWRSRPMTLEVDHINGDWSDNRAGNLRLLCPNCHATTDTYCVRNQGRVPRQRAATTDPGSRPS